MSFSPLHSPNNDQSDVVSPQIQQTLTQIQSDSITQSIKNPHQEQETKSQETEIPLENALIPFETPQPIQECHVSDLGLETKNLKKGNGISKSKSKKQQMFSKKAQSLMGNLNVIPFIPSKILDFYKHEPLLRKLGLWDFVNIEFDKNLRIDLIAQLVVSYDWRGSYVNGYRVKVSKSELARAFKISTKREKGNGVDCDLEKLSDDSIHFMVEFVEDWVLRHEDAWDMPDEVLNWVNVIKGGNPERVDWAGLLWFMVEKELVQRESLRECYYAAHLQYLMKEQKVFLREEADGKCVEMDGDEDVDDAVDTLQEEGEENVDGAVKFQEEREVAEENGDDVMFQEEEEENVNVGLTFQEDAEIEGLSVELALGHEEGEEIKDEGIMDVENSREESDEEGVKVNEQGQWLMNGKNDMGDYFLQRCNPSRGNEIGHTLNGGIEEQEDVEFVEDDEETEDRNDVFPNDHLVGEGLTDNFLRAMEMDHMAFEPQGHEISMQDMDPGPSFFNGSGKRPIEEDNMFNHSLNHDSNKRLKMNVFTDTNPGTCMGYIQQMVGQASSLYAEKEQEFEQKNLTRQILLDELQKRDNLIESLNKSRIENMRKKDEEIYRYEKELHVMGNMLIGYRKAVKERQKAFDEYREKVKLPEEPAYKDVGGGLMLSTGEIARIRKRQEEEFQVNCLIIQQRMKEAEDNFAVQFDAFREKVNMMDWRLTRLDADAKEVIGLFAKRKVLKIEGKMLECTEAVVDNEEQVPVGDNEENAMAVDNEEEMPVMDNEEKGNVSDNEDQVMKNEENVPVMDNEEKVNVSDKEEQVPEPVMDNEEKVNVSDKEEQVPVAENEEKIIDVGNEDMENEEAVGNEEIVPDVAPETSA